MWQEFLQAQEKNFGKEVVDKWLRPLTLVEEGKGILKLEAQDPFQLLWFNEHIKEDLKKDKKLKVSISLKGVLPQKREIKQSAAPLFSPDPLDVTMRLENFFVAEDNKVLVKTLEAGSNPPLYNPIYIYGPHGVGKTHLLTALTLLYKEKGFNPLYVKAETFTEHVVYAMRNSCMQQFRQHYRAASPLLIDDIHILARRTATQEEFFHTFNTLHMAGKQIIVAGNSLPSRLEEIEPRLTSRFEWGMTFPLHPLQGHLSTLLEKKIEELSLSLSHATKEWLLSQFQEVHSLSCALNGILLRTHLKRLDPHSLEPCDLKVLLHDLLLAQKEKALSMEKIVETTCSFYGLTTRTLLGTSHAKEHANARHLAIYLCREKLSYPFAKIGRFFSRDHSTIMASVQRIEKKIEEKESETLEILRELKRRLE